MSDLKPIASSLGQIASLNACSNGIAPSEAAHAARTMFGCYRRGEANDPETYAAAIAAVLTLYPPEIVHRITDPRTGLPSRLKFLPTVSEVREACEEEAQVEARRIERQAQIDKQLEERRRFEEAQTAARPTLEELKAKHGDNWGIKHEDRLPDAKDARRENMQRINRRMHERECLDAGLDPAGPSAALVKLLREQGEKRNAG